MKSEKGFVIENRYYEIILSNSGGITSWKEKRKPHHVKREIVKKG